MSNLRKFADNSKELVIPDKYPIIWKVESCLRGECKDERTHHRWSIPFSAPDGLRSECYDCHKSRDVKVDKGNDKIKHEPSEYVKKRKLELGIK